MERLKEQEGKRSLQQCHFFGSDEITGSEGIQIDAAADPQPGGEPDGNCPRRRDIGGGARVRAGIEFNALGQRTAYWVMRDRPGDPLTSVRREPLRLPAADCLHLFKPLAAGQLRGITWLAPVLLRLHELDQFEDAALVKAKVAALFTGFNLRGSARVGVGMMPRGEVALIIAGIGLSQGIIAQNLFGVSIMMTVITTLLAPIILIPLIKVEGSGLRCPETDDTEVLSSGPGSIIAEDSANDD